MYGGLSSCEYVEFRIIALDTRTGGLFSYDIMKNPNGKIPHEIGAMRMLFPLPAV